MFGETTTKNIRILQPPGGGSSDIFGVGNTYSSPPTSNSPASVEKTHTSENQPATPSSANQNSSSPQNNSTDQTKPSREPSFKMRNRQGAFNPITGEPYTPTTTGAKQETDKNKCDNTQQSGSGKAHAEIHTSSRVLNPPGGPTTKLW